MCPFINLRSKLEFMHLDARELDNNTIIEGDLCIVGAGAAGISMALDWNKSGKKVILLEGGGLNTTVKFRTFIPETQRDRGIILCAHAGSTYLEGQQVIGEVCAPLLIR